jgi:ribosome-associated protein
MQPAIRQYYRLEEIWGEKPVKLGAAKRKSSTEGLEAAAAPKTKSTHLAANQDQPDVKPVNERKPAAKRASTVSKSSAAAGTAAKKPAAKKPAAKKVPTGATVRVAVPKAAAADAAAAKAAKTAATKRATKAAAPAAAEAAAPAKKVIRRIKKSDE